MARIRNNKKQPKTITSIHPPCTMIPRLCY
jgi:hypothetical protein